MVMLENFRNNISMYGCSKTVTLMLESECPDFLKCAPVACWVSFLNMYPLCSNILFLVVLSLTPTYLFNPGLVLLSVHIEL